MAVTMEGLFSAKSVPGGTSSELNARASKKWNPALGQAKTWAHVMSLAEGSPYPITKYTSFGDAYDGNNRPKALIDSIKIASKGEFGTTRRGTVTLLVFNEDELNKIADAYFIPDMSIRIQWGWTVNAAGAGPPSPMTGASYDSDAVKAMEGMSASSPATYCGFQGRIISWDITLQPTENVWQVTLEAVGAGDSISETPVSTASDNCNCKKEVTGGAGAEEEEGKEVVEKSSNLQAALLELWDSPGFISNIQSGLKGGGEYMAEEIAYPGFSRDENGQEDSSGFLWIDADLDARETFISWGTVESLLSRCSGQPWAGSSPAVFEIDSRGIEINVPTTDRGNWFSADPRVCILPGGGLIFEQPTEWTDYLGGLGLLFDAAKTSDFPQATGNCFNGSNSIRLTGIMVSTVHLLKRVREFEKNKTPIIQAVQTLLKDINVACGNVWEFEVIDVTDQDGANPSPGVTKLAIIDANSAPAKNSTFSFKATPEGGFCRDIKLELKMTDAMKTQALYGAGGNTEVPAGPACNSRFIMYSRGKKKNLGKVTDASGKSPDTFCNGGEKCNPGNETEHPVDKLQKEAVSANIDGARIYLENQKQKDESNGSAYCKNSILPMNFSATVSGIGGFRWGQTVTCDRIPQEMRDAVVYQVTTVEHNVTADDWTTTVNTIARKT